MKVHVFAATTRGPVQIERITREAAPLSQMCLGRTTSVLPVSPDYDAFVRPPSGVIERALGPFEPGGFRLDASDEIGDGRSWQLSVLVAHALHRAGRLAGPGESADAILWITGTVDVDLRVGAVDFVGEKLRATRERFAARAAEGAPPVTVVVPAANLEDAAGGHGVPGVGEILGVRDANEVLRHVGLAPAAVPAAGAPDGARDLVPLDLGPVRIPGWRLAWSAASLLALGGLVAFLMLSSADRPPGLTFRDCAACPEMVAVPGGAFVMGSPPGEAARSAVEGPAREVAVAAFAIGRFEVTRREFTSFVEETGHDAGDSCYVRTGSGGRRDPSRSWRDPGYPQGEDDPAVCVSWNTARAYAAWLAGKTGRAYRLPSEAEWEYAARAGTRTPFHTGPTITPDQANYNGTSSYGAGGKGAYRKRTVPVGGFPPNAFGLHDVHGNAWEWVEDCWNDSYRGAPADGAPRLSGSCEHRVMRGGSWRSRPKDVRSAKRVRFPLEYRNDNFGFRVARPLGD